MNTHTYRGGFSKALRKKGTYRWGKESFDAVSTVLGILDKPALPRWASKSVALRVKSLINRYEWTKELLAKASTEEDIATVKRLGLTGPQLMAALADETDLANSPWAYRDKRAELGTRVHDVGEAYALGLPIPDSFGGEVEERMARTMYSWLEANPMKFLMAEATVSNHSSSVAGTLDWVVEWGAHRWALDIKTGSGVYREHGLQLGAYATMDTILIPGQATIEDTVVEGATRNDEVPGWEYPMFEIERVGILHIQPTFARLYEFDLSEVVPAWEATVDAYRAVNRVEEPRLGPVWELEEVTA